MQKKIIVSAGDAVTAKLVEEAGFDGIWVSGFEASARMGLADNGSLKMTEMLNITKPIVDAVSIPVYVDVDTGYGNFKRTLREFEKIGASGVCIEDNLATCKVNSLWGSQIPLLSMEEYGEKIRIKDRKIKIIARTEAIIRGYGHAEAEKRLKYYIKCGADIVLPHIRSVNDLIPYYFNKPVAIVPTKLPNITNAELFKMGYSIVIWANQTERVKIKAIREALKTLKKDDSAKHIEKSLSSTLEDMKGLMPDE